MSSAEKYRKFFSLRKVMRLEMKNLFAVNMNKKIYVTGVQI